MEAAICRSRRSEGLREECGVFGIARHPWDSRELAYDVYNALFALQHRGQDSCGIAGCRDGGLQAYKNQGLVPEALTAEVLESFKGCQMAIGHVRHAGSLGDTNPNNAQPILVKHKSGSLALCYNGKLVNAAELRAETENRGGIFQTTNDAEVISYLIVREHLRTYTLADAVENAMQYMIGAYSLLVLDKSCLIAARDPNGYRPLCMGMVDDSIVFASESCAIEALGGRFLRDVKPGEIVVAEKGKVSSRHCGIRAKSNLCVFELLYFARQDSVIGGLPVVRAREAAGRRLAQMARTEGDIVIGVPDSGIAAAMGYARESGIPYGYGLMKNRYIQRTFIESRQWEREKSTRVKLNPIAETVRGRRIILVDDSIVRGTTCRRIIQTLRKAGAAEVHMKSTAPPFLHPCYFGTALPPTEQLAASGRSLEQIRADIGADSLQYLTPEDLHHVAKGLNQGFCDACFTGQYAVPVPEPVARPEKEVSLI